MYSVAETAKILQVDKKHIKDWSFHFSEYLSPQANPQKDKQRFYTLEDIRIFAYVLIYWEDEPDIENIKNGFKLSGLLPH